MASRCVLYIFQLPAMIGLRGTLPPGGRLAARHPNLQRDQAGELLAFEELEHRAAAGRGVVDLVCIPELLQRGDAVSPADDGERAAFRNRLRDRARPVGELVD